MIYMPEERCILLNRLSFFKSSDEDLFSMINKNFFWPW